MLIDQPLFERILAKDPGLDATFFQSLLREAAVLKSRYRMPFVFDRALNNMRVGDVTKRKAYKSALASYFGTHGGRKKKGEGKRARKPTHPTQLIEESGQYAFDI